MGNGLLSGKKIAIFGVANKRSIAYSIAKALAREGATLALSYQGERLKDTVQEFANELGATYVAPCDVTNEAELTAFFSGLKDEFGSLDCLVHSIAFALKDDLRGRYIDISREGSKIAHDVSADSLRVLAQAAEPMMNEGGSIMTLTYLGSTYAFPNYNVMGPAKASLEATVRYLAYDLGEKKVRVNAISAPPIKTLAARTISGLSEMLAAYEDKAPLGLQDVDSVADVAVFLASDLSRSITAETLVCDGGFSRMGH